MDKKNKLKLYPLKIIKVKERINNFIYKIIKVKKNNLSLYNGTH